MIFFKNEFYVIFFEDLSMSNIFKMNFAFISCDRPQHEWYFLLEFFYMYFDNHSISDIFLCTVVLVHILIL